MWYLVQHVIWTTNPWRLLMVGYATGCACMFAGLWLVRSRQGVRA